MLKIPEKIIKNQSEFLITLNDLRNFFWIFFQFFSIFLEILKEKLLWKKSLKII